MAGLSTMLKPIARLKKLLLNRPRGLKRLGKDTWVMRPWRFEGPSCIEIGSNTNIMATSNICAVKEYEGKQYSPTLQIGNGVYIGHYVFITAIRDVRIGDHCSFSEHVYVTDFFHRFDPEKGPIMKQDLISKGPVSIGSNCFLGYRVAVMPGVTLGDWCIVGANSVVTRSFPSYSMIAGAPAKLVKIYSHEAGEWITPPRIEAVR